jgi:hypothetical protein
MYKQKIRTYIRQKQQAEGKRERKKEKKRIKYLNQLTAAALNDISSHFN